jgi:hypothetical protein
MIIFGPSGKLTTLDDHVVLLNLHPTLKDIVASLFVLQQRNDRHPIDDQ